ncbi:MAG: GrpB family protein [Minisyncoccia bacterium]
MKNNRKVEVIDYQIDWNKKFEDESEILREILKDIIVDIHHIGSTAIPNIKAKPIIDILIEVKEIDKVDQFNDKLIQQGYIPLGENQIPNRRFFIKGDEINRTHHVHVFQTGNPEIARHIRFRDYLINHPDEAKAYSDLKDDLAKKYSYNIEEYIKGKDHFIKEIDQKAMKEQEAR